MSDQTNFEMRLYSPRWGHEDAYHMQLERHQLSVRVLGNRAVCSWVEGFDPEWLGHSGGSRNPLEKILENDSIHPPSVFVRALEYAWIAWRDETLDDSQVKAELQALCDWLNTVSRNKPSSDFWRGIF